MNEKRKNTIPTNPKELDAMSDEFDKELIANSFRPMTRTERTKYRRLILKRGRPKVGAGAKAISVTVEKTLLKEVDRIARRRRTTRASLVAKGLRTIIRQEREAEKSARRKTG